ncbi:hypothetical protein JJL19_14800, partial [Staphylococcus aureus]|nr:hypothetical protein [Staphylococcus aureus]
SQTPNELSSNTREVQSSYDKDIEKRRIQNHQTHQNQHHSNTNSDQYRRSAQHNNRNEAEKRLKEQKDISKHGK